MNQQPQGDFTIRRGSSAEVFRVFLGLGLTSFGGLVAHLAYFHDAFVVRRRWVGERAYADLVALCQLLPGPTSSQVGMGVGLQRAGYAGLIAAWAGFTLPSTVLMVAFAYGASTLGADAGTGWVQGLKAAAVAVVAYAVLGMARGLTPDRERATIAIAGFILAVLVPNAVGQVLVILLGGFIGLTWLRPVLAKEAEHEMIAVPIDRRAGILFLAGFAIILFALPPLATLTGNSALRMADGFFRAGSLVFGGGHVVLPLLQAEFVETGLVGKEAFLAGYGAAQAVPGPLFSFSAYLGAVYQTSPSGVRGAALALVSIFLPSALLVMGILPMWDTLRRAPVVRRVLLGVNAAVVGLLAAALYDPVFAEGITSPTAMAIAAASFAALTAWNAPAWTVVIAAAALGFVFL